MNFKIIGITAGVLILFLILGFAFFVKRVEPGYEGVKVHLLGGDKGVDAEEVGVGYTFVGLNQSLYEFPLFEQNYVWTQDPTEGSENDESFTFQTKESMDIGADVGITYHIEPGRSADIFVKYRRGVEEITDVFLRNHVRDAMNMIAPSFTVDSLNGIGKPAFMEAVENYVKKQVAPQGIVVERVYLIGKLRIPEVIRNAINAKIAATQKAIEQENSEREEAAKVRIRIAKAAAKKAEMEAESQALTPEVLRLKAIERWDGKLPQYMGGDTPLPFMKVN